MRSPDGSLRVMTFQTGFYIFLSLLILWTSWPTFQNAFGYMVGPASVMSDQFSWAPLIQRMSEGVLFPVNSALGSEEMGFAYYPYLSLWVAALFVKFFGLKWAWFLLGTLGGLASYGLIYKIFRRSLSSDWSTALSFLCLISFVDLPFRKFLAALVLGESLPTGIEPLAISHVPFPALSLPIFLGLFYFSTQLKRYELKELLFLTLGWGLQAYVHPTNAVVGSVFWAFALYFYLRRLYPGNSLQIFRVGLFFVGLLCVLQIPYALSFLGKVGASHLELEALDLKLRASTSNISVFYWLAYFVGPLATTLLLSAVYKLDPKEVLYRFWPVVALLLTEFLVLFGHKIFGFSLSSNLIFNRFALLFGHIYVYVPLLYFLTKRLPHHHLYNFPKSLVQIRNVLSFVFHRMAQVFLVILCALLVFFGGYNGFTQSQNLQSSLSLQQSEEIPWSSLGGRPLQIGFPEVSANFFFPLREGSEKYGSLFLNRFSNQVDVDTALKGFAVYALFRSWTFEEFRRFLSPGSFQEGHLVDLREPQVLDSGLGYWYVFHNRGDLEVSEELLKKTFEEAKSLSWEKTPWGLKMTSMVSMDDHQKEHAE